ncbi:MAG: hypothetical protein K6G50_03410 [bacterium]|nr:hypothetical protein [bacterium]
MIERLRGKIKGQINRVKREASMKIEETKQRLVRKAAEKVLEILIPHPPVEH